MSQFTVEDLKQLLSSCAGLDDAATLDGDVLHVAFADLGYDSLAILELASQVQRTYGVAMPDEAVEHMVSPQAAVDYVNIRLVEVSA
jgi:minimal PKS acyl carrier protein